MTLCVTVKLFSLATGNLQAGLGVEIRLKIYSFFSLRSRFSGSGMCQARDSGFA